MAKLAMTRPADVYEREADRVAHEVTRPSRAPRLACRCGGTCPRCKAEKKARETLAQPRRAASVADHASRVPPVIGAAVRSPGQSLDKAIRGPLEGRLGHDFGSVRIHVDDAATTAARALEARAFTLGEDIVFDRREYAPRTREGRLLLAHELVHVVQQTSGDRAPSVPAITRAAPVIARGEKWDAIWGVGPLDAMKAKDLADKALAAAGKTGLPGLRNGPADAWRHCYWNCLMTDEIGKGQAAFVAENHEKHGGGPAAENMMDARNNWEGRACGGRDCDSCCQTKLDAGKLDVIEAGKMVPSKPTKRSGGKQADKY